MQYNFPLIHCFNAPIYFRCGLLLYYRHQDNNIITFIVDGALKASADGQIGSNVYQQVEPKKVDPRGRHQKLLENFCPKCV